MKNDLIDKVLEILNVIKQLDDIETIQISIESLIDYLKDKKYLCQVRKK